MEWHVSKLVRLSDYPDSVGFAVHVDVPESDTFGAAASAEQQQSDQNVVDLVSNGGNDLLKVLTRVHLRFHVWLAWQHDGSAGIQRDHAEILGIAVRGAYAGEVATNRRHLIHRKKRIEVLLYIESGC